ncbi:MAG: DEAD/DEAH box helicase family protein [bacterium]|nr:DEAD/DEAH box helicase family protein [bacterium]
MRLKNYQTNAIDELLKKAKKLFSYADNKRLIFKAPTGSGKTIMMAEFLKQLCEDKEVKSQLSFIWTAPRQLHEQSKNKLDHYYEPNRALSCSFFEDLDDKRIDQNEILFFNWESINRENNIYIRDNEHDNNLSNIIANTREEGRTIILIIDESHHHATSDISQNLIRDIGPKLTIEVSATPVLESPDEIVSVQLEDVKTEGMIKKAVILNPELENILKDTKIKSQLSKQSEELVIELALKKRKALKDAYEKEKLYINPLVLVQLPDRHTSLEDVIKDKVIALLKNKHKITTENGKLAIHLSGHHENLENISKFDNEADVLIFKQALALGWDCPRAHILVLFRDWHSIVFSIQTIGRIMRMPDPDYGHYTNEILNYGYIFTNLDDIEIQEDIARDYITIHTSRRRSDYSPLDISSCHSKRHREKTRLSPLFIKYFLQEADSYDLIHKIDRKSKGVSLKLISNYTAESIDELVGATIVGDKAVTLSGFDLQKYFDYFVRKNLTPYHPEDRSIGRLKEAIYYFFDRALKIKYEEVQEDIIALVLHEQNMQHFINVIDQAKTKYQQTVSDREKELDYDEKWDIPESINFGSQSVAENQKKAIMQPFYNNGRSALETAFINYLEKPNKIAWWFKNGDRDSVFFAVPYKENGDIKPFYVDFIVRMKDGTIGLFDTKSGLTRQVAGPKVDGLYSYIQDQRRKGIKIFGGIVTNTDSRNYNGRWIYFTKKSNELTNNMDNWDTLSL